MKKILYISLIIIFTISCKKEEVIENLNNNELIFNADYLEGVYVVSSNCSSNLTSTLTSTLTSSLTNTILNGDYLSFILKADGLLENEIMIENNKAIISIDSTIKFMIIDDKNELNIPQSGYISNDGIIINYLNSDDFSSCSKEFTKQ